MFEHKSGIVSTQSPLTSSSYPSGISVCISSIFGHTSETSSSTQRPAPVTQYVCSKSIYAEGL